MCGRFAFYSPAEATAALFGATGSVDLKPRYNIAPTQYIAAIRNDVHANRELVAFRWGLVPFWAKDPSIGSRMINARAETVAEKPSFRNAYRKRRCLVLADGFYEWHTEGGAKVPYYISLANGGPCAFAGLWEHWESKETDETLETATIVTTAASEFLSQLHHRMPVVLEPASADRWMGGDLSLLDEVAGAGPRMRAWPVDRRVGNARNESDDLADPAGDPIS
ncbi:MAG: SOS response-associated peptidase [Gammaproteobacteria bacterium]|nr:SOS response-associated peptidase [Gammaproteobacteria bacterium]